MDWYKKQNIHLKIRIKSHICEMVTGFEYEDLLNIFNQKEIMDIIACKLINEGFILEC